MKYQKTPNTKFSTKNNRAKHAYEASKSYTVKSCETKTLTTQAVSA